SKANLIKFAREEAGLNPPETLKKEELIQWLIENGVEFEPDVQGPAESAEAASDSVAELEKTKVRIVLFDKPDDPLKQLTLGVNGVHVTLLRGVDVTVPYPVYEVLKNAITLERRQVGNEIVERRVQTEPFQVIKFDVQPGDFPEAEA
ncbi:MAG TPA: hypothetical protein VN030_11570, partial [Cellvibrio sp.]|nr:hypothetical protein [Cellvibrio sp.]